VKNWDLFTRGLKGYREDAEKDGDLAQHFGEEPSGFCDRLERELDGCKLFSIDNDVKELLIKTDGEKEINHLPFDKMFLDVTFDAQEFKEEQFGSLITEVRGMLVVKADEFITRFIREGEDFVDKIPGDGFIIYILAMDVDGGGGFNNFQIVDRLDAFGDNWSKGHIISTPKLRNFCINFVSNLLSMMNNPEDIQYIEKNLSEAKNKQRLRKGLVALPNSTVIVPVGNLRKYINDLKSGGSIDYTHKFWVRGHWRTLRNEERYGDKVGKRMWIKPFIKGKGILIDKKYDVKLKDKDDKLIT